MVTLNPPAQEIRLSIAIAFYRLSEPERIGLAALALCLSWPFPPWESRAQEELERAEREEREAGQFLKVARPDETATARMALLQARQSLQLAREKLAEQGFQLRDLAADGRAALARLDAASVSPAQWYGPAQSLLAQWLSELAPADPDSVAELVSFTVPPPAPTSAGGSNSPGTTAAMR